MVSLLYPLIITLLSVFTKSEEFNESVLQSSNKRSDHYVGAVVEFAPTESDVLESPQEVLTVNIDKYLGYMMEAAEAGADIIVFPEYGLTGVGVSNLVEDRVRARQFMVVGEVGRNYCHRSNDNNNDEMMQMMACGAVEHNMYMVVNIGEAVDCEEQGIECMHGDGYNLYNTNLVFDRTGVLVAKYWKQNLFFEPVFDVPSQPMFTTFTTDFGVTFGTFTCFDSLWNQAFDLIEKFPNVTDIAFPTSWVDELPFFTAVQVQAAWAVTNNVNFLASGRHAPLSHALGSGIYSPSGPLNYTYDSGGSKLITSEIPKRKVSDVSRESKKPQFGGMNNNLLGALFEDITAYTKLEMKKGEYEEVSLCHNNDNTDTFCCEARYNISNSNNARYMLLAYDGLRAMAIPGMFLPIQMCGVTRCLGAEGECTLTVPGKDQGETFHSLSLASKDFGPRTIVFPSLMNSDALLPDWRDVTFKKEKNEVQIEIDDTDMYSAALYGRVKE